METVHPECSNLGPNEIKKRKVVGTIGLILYVGMMYYFLNYESSLFYHFLIFIPYVITIVGFYQAEQKTCLAIAVQGKENLDKGNVYVKEDEKRKALIAKGREMIKKTLISSTLLTLITVVFIL